MCGNLGTPPFAIILGILPSQNTVFGLVQFRNPVKLVFDHHTITNKPHNIQIHPENRTKPVGHYMASRRKITSAGGNLPLVAQFRVLCSLGLLTAEHSFLFLFLCHACMPFPCIVTHGLPCVTHMVGHMSSTWLAMCRPTPVALKYLKFRLSRNSTKFD